MDYLIFVAISIAIIVILLVSKHIIKKHMQNTIYDENNAKIIRQPMTYLYAGIGGMVVFVAIALFCLFAPENMIANYEEGMHLAGFIVFIIISIPYAFLIMLQINWKIEIGESEFTYKNIFGKKHIYQFDSVDVKQRKTCTRFYYNDKYVVGISYLQQNWDALEKAIQKNKNS